MHETLQTIGIIALSALFSLMLWPLWIFAAPAIAMWYLTPSGPDLDSALA
jgi:hypothetical protein